MTSWLIFQGLKCQIYSYQSLKINIKNHKVYWIKKNIQFLEIKAGLRWSVHLSIKCYLMRYKIVDDWAEIIFIKYQNSYWFKNRRKKLLLHNS
jgi:hypothetical protein